jgi:hypothetical protein
VLHRPKAGLLEQRRPDALPSPHAADARWFEGVHSAPPTDIAYLFSHPNGFLLKKVAVSILLGFGLVFGGRLATPQRRRCSVIASQAIFCVLYRLAIIRLCDDRSTKREEHDQRYAKLHISSYTVS